jgi:hypothetical protein
MPGFDTPELDEERFCRAKSLLSKLIGLPSLKREFEGQEPSCSQRVYTQAPTLWLLVMQRLGGGLSLDQVVKDLINNNRDLLPENRRTSEGTLSENNSAYNAARKRLPLEVIERFSRRICDYLANHAEPAFEDQRVFILDGTTITLPPTAELKKAFPPTPNQHGESVWPVAMLLVAHEMQTGCAMVPQIDPMFGPNNSSESKQADRAIGQLPDNSIVMADSGFGIFSVAHSCQRHGKNFVLRLTKQRYNSHHKKAKLVQEGRGFRTEHMIWKPSVKERRNNAEIPADAAIEAFVHRIDLEDGQTLELITDLEFDALSIGELYRRRYDIEFDIRDLKVTMGTEKIRAKSVDMVMKELLGSIIAYNLVSQLRKQAAKLVNLAPRRLSFQGVWTTFQWDLLFKDFATAADAILAYQRALISASGRKLPDRKGRSYPRIAHTRRQKSTKFQRQQRKIAAKKTDNRPPD